MSDENDKKESTPEQDFGTMIYKEFIRPFFSDVYHSIPSAEERRNNYNSLIARFNRGVSCDVFESKENITVSCDVPGISKKEIEINVDSDRKVLKISGETRVKKEQQDPNGNFHLNERAYGQFERSFKLPYNAQMERVKASYKDGILDVIIPKGKEISEEQRYKKVYVE